MLFISSSEVNTTTCLLGNWTTLPECGISFCDAPTQGPHQIDLSDSVFNVGDRFALTDKIASRKLNANCNSKLSYTFCCSLIEQFRLTQPTMWRVNRSMKGTYPLPVTVLGSGKGKATAVRLRVLSQPLSATEHPTSLGRGCMLTRLFRTTVLKDINWQVREASNQARHSNTLEKGFETIAYTPMACVVDAMEIFIRLPHR